MNNYSISIHWDSKNEEFIATSKEFPFLSGIADKKEKSLEILEECIENALEMLDDENESSPETFCMPE